MKTQIVELNQEEINEQARLAKKCYDLIQKELGYSDLCNLENIAKYSKSFKYHSNLAKTGTIEMPLI